MLCRLSVSRDLVVINDQFQYDDDSGAFLVFPFLYRYGGICAMFSTEAMS